MTHYRLLTLVLLPMTMLATSTAAQTHAASTPAPVPAPPAPRDGVHDFDFLHGTWTIRNRRLRQPLSGSGEWYEFEGRSVERPIWDGQGNLEEYEATLPDGTPLRGLALRLYDPGAKRWTIHWSSSVNGTLDPPMTGTFRDGVGEFFSHEDFQGRMILVRFHWTSAGPDEARWEQAFSPDGGRTWETNWVMEFTRTMPREAPRASAEPGTEPGGPAALERTAPQEPALRGGGLPQPCCRVVELRQYTLHPGARDTLIELFDREFVESQEAEGMTVIAQFRDLDRPDVFTWLRGFPDMPSRASSLTAFYGGPIWAAHREAANRTMLSSDNVRLLRPARGSSGFVLRERAGTAGGPAPSGLVVATIYTLAPSESGEFTEFFERAVLPRLVASGAPPIAVFETEPSENNFPRLPVREGEHAFVWFSHFPGTDAHQRHLATLADDPRWRTEVQPALDRYLAAPVEVWRLAPTARSRAIR